MGFTLYLFMFLAAWLVPRPASAAAECAKHAVNLPEVQANRARCEKYAARLKEAKRELEKIEKETSEKGAQKTLTLEKEKASRDLILRHKQQLSQVETHYRALAKRAQEDEKALREAAREAAQGVDQLAGTRDRLQKELDEKNTARRSAIFERDTARQRNLGHVRQRERLVGGGSAPDSARIRQLDEVILRGHQENQRREDQIEALAQPIAELEKKIGAVSGAIAESRQLDTHTSKLVKGLQQSTRETEKAADSAKSANDRLDPSRLGSLEEAESTLKKADEEKKSTVSGMDKIREQGERGEVVAEGADANARGDKLAAGRKEDDLLNATQRQARVDNAKELSAIEDATTKKGGADNVRQELAQRYEKLEKIQNEINALDPVNTDKPDSPQAKRAKELAESYNKELAELREDPALARQAAKDGVKELQPNKMIQRYESPEMAGYAASCAGGICAGAMPEQMYRAEAKGIDSEAVAAMKKSSGTDSIREDQSDLATAVTKESGRQQAVRTAIEGAKVAPGQLVATQDPMGGTIVAVAEDHSQMVAAQEVTQNPYAAGVALNDRGKAEEVKAVSTQITAERVEDWTAGAAALAPGGSVLDMVRSDDYERRMTGAQLQSGGKSDVVNRVANNAVEDAQFNRTYGLALDSADLIPVGAMAKTGKALDNVSGLASSGTDAAKAVTKTSDDLGTAVARNTPVAHTASDSTSTTETVAPARAAARTNSEASVRNSAATTENAHTETVEAVRPSRRSSSTSSESQATPTERAPATAQTKAAAPTGSEKAARTAESYESVAAPTPSSQRTTGGGIAKVEQESAVSVPPSSYYTPPAATQPTPSRATTLQTTAATENGISGGTRAPARTTPATAAAGTSPGTATNAIAQSANTRVKSANAVSTVEKSAESAPRAAPTRMSTQASLSGEAKPSAAAQNPKKLSSVADAMHGRWQESARASGRTERFKPAKMESGAFSADPTRGIRSALDDLGVSPGQRPNYQIANYRKEVGADGKSKDVLAATSRVNKNDELVYFDDGGKAISAQRYRATVRDTTPALEEDILALPNRRLSPNNKKENDLGANAAWRAMKDHEDRVASGKPATKSLEDSLEKIHGEWLERNSWAAGDPQYAGSWKKLSPEMKIADLDPLEDAMRVAYKGNPEVEAKMAPVTALRRELESSRDAAKAAKNTAPKEIPAVADAMHDRWQESARAAGRTSRFKPAKTASGASAADPAKGIRAALEEIKAPKEARAHYQIAHYFKEVGADGKSRDILSATSRVNGANRVGYYDGSGNSISAKRFQAITRDTTPTFEEDILALPNRRLSANNKKENDLGAEAAWRAMKEHEGRVAAGVSPGKSLEESLEKIHSDWLSRNGWAAGDAKYAGSWKNLSPEMKIADLDPLEDAMRVAQKGQGDVEKKLAAVTNLRRELEAARDSEKAGTAASRSPSSIAISPKPEAIYRDLLADPKLQPKWETLRKTIGPGATDELAVALSHADGAARDALVAKLDRIRPENASLIRRELSNARSCAVKR